MKLLFLTWDGPGTAYHEALFVPLLQRARRPSDSVELHQFTWGEPDRSTRIASAATKCGMGYHAWKVPRGRTSARLPIVLARATLDIAGRIHRGEVDVILARSIAPATVALTLQLFLRRRFTFVFDADGLVADERAEFGGWHPRGLRYRAFRRIERLAVRRSNFVVTRTKRAKEVLRQRANVEASKINIVVNGKDAHVFSPGNDRSRQATRDRLGIPARVPVVIYVGSIGPQYLASEMLNVFNALSAADPTSHLVMLAAERHHGALEELTKHVSADRLHIQSVSPSQVPELVSMADLGLALRSPTLSQQAVAPIKVGEYLLCGLPVIFTRGSSDLDELLGSNVAFAMGEGDRSDPSHLVAWFSEVYRVREQTRRQARVLGLQRFSLKVGGASYRHVFDCVEAAR